MLHNMEMSWTIEHKTFFCENFLKKAWIMLKYLNELYKLLSSMLEFSKKNECLRSFNFEMDSFDICIQLRKVETLTTTFS